MRAVDRGGRGPWGAVAAVVAIAVCCALPEVLVVAGGAIAAVGGAVLRYWPITVAGVAAVVWASLRVARVVRGSRTRGRGKNSS